MMHGTVNVKSLYTCQFTRQRSFQNHRWENPIFHLEVDLIVGDFIGISDDLIYSKFYITVFYGNE